MPPAPYPDFRWFFRTLRVVPVVAVAALAGGAIGGFSVFAIDVALTAPPNHGVPPEPGSKLASATTDDNAAVSTTPQSLHPQSSAVQTSTPQSPTPMRTFDAATPAAKAAVPAAAIATATETPTTETPTPAAPARSAADSSAALTSNLAAVSESTAVSAQNVSSAQPTAAAMRSTPSGTINGAITVVHPQTDAANEQQPQPQRLSWPDALSREQPRTGVQPETITAERPGEPNTTAKTSTVATSTVESAANSAPMLGAKPDTIRRHVAVKRALPPTERSGEASLAHGRPIYDDYSRDNDRSAEDGTRTKYRTAEPQPDTRRQSPAADVARSGDRDDRRLYDHDRSDQRDDDDSQDALPPQPPPLPFFGLFGGGDRD